MIANFPALQVFLPLIMAPLCVLLSRKGRFAWLISTVVTIVVAVMTLATFSHVSSTGSEITYHMGGWPPPIGIEYRIDLLSGAMLVLVSIIAAVVMPFAFKSVNHEIRAERQPYFYAAFLLCLSGLLGIISTNDAFNLYVFLEISSLSSYALIALGQDRRALSSSFQYLVLGTIGATFILIGVGFLYIMTGTLNISDLAERVPDIAHSRPVLAAFAFIIVGLCMKIALFPLHMWLPNAYAYAPSAVSVFFAGVATKVGVYAILRFFYTLFGHDFSFSGMHLAMVFLALAVPAILIGSFVAVFENNLKRMLAFSSIAQIGYITLGIGLGTEDGLTAAIIHIFNHAFVKASLFMALGCMAYRLHGKTRLNDIRGMGRHMPFTSFAFVLAGFGLIGVPLTSGFISKWYLLTATLEEEWWLLTAVIIISSLAATVYIWKVIEALYFGHPKEENDQVVEAPAMMVFPLWMLTSMVIVLGIHTKLNVGVAAAIARYLMGGEP